MGDVVDRVHDDDAATGLVGGIDDPLGSRPIGHSSGLVMKLATATAVRG
jgi:hypothetical protein